MINSKILKDYYNNYCHNIIIVFVYKYNCFIIINHMDDKLLIRQSSFSIIQLHKPISIHQCIIHKNTAVIGKPLFNSKLCKCCGLKYQKQQLDCMFSIQDIFYNGSGLPLYFEFIKTCIIITLVCTLQFSSSSLYFNFITKSCDQSQILNCAKTPYLQLSVANKLDNHFLLKIQAYIADATIVTMFFLFQIMRKRMRNLSIEAQQESNESDYAIMIQMADNNYDKLDIQRGIQQWWQKQIQNKTQKILQNCQDNFPIISIIISYELSNYLELEKQLQQLIKQSKLKIKKKKNQQNKEHLNRIKQIRSIIKQKSFLKNNRAIVVFKYPEQKQYILQKHQLTFFSWLFPFCYNRLKIDGKPVRVKKAALPTQVSWQNHQISHRKKFWMRILIRVFCIVLIIASEAGIYGLLKYWFVNKTHGDPNFEKYVSPIISISINIINLLLYKILTYITKFEFRSTKLQLKVSITIKVIVCIFLNSGIMLLAVYFFLDINSIWISNGFIETISLSFLLVIVLPHFIQYINIDFLLRFLNKLRIRFISTSVLQKEANLIYQRIDVELYQKYAWMVNLLWWSSIFAPLVPIAYPCACISLIFHYWNEKFMYVALLKEPKPFGNYLNLEMFNLLQMTPLFLACGNFCLNLILLEMQGQTLELYQFFADIIAITFSLLIYIIPSENLNKILSCCFFIEKQKDIKNIQYQQASRKFITTYQMQNPIYKQAAIKNRIQSKKNAVNHIKNQNQIHPLKQYMANIQEQSFDMPYSPRIQMKKSQSKFFIPPLPISNKLNEPDKNKQIELVNIREIFEDTQIRQKVTRQVKKNVQKLKK